MNKGLLERLIKDDVKGEATLTGREALDILDTCFGLMRNECMAIIKENGIVTGPFELIARALDNVMMDCDRFNKERGLQ